MTAEREAFIIKIFNSYKNNVCKLGQLDRPSIRGVAYDNIVVQTDKSKNAIEQLVITYLIDKERLEKEILLVDKVYDFFADDRNIELAKLIDVRFRRGVPHWKSANSCYISDRQALRWLKKAYEKADEIGKVLGLFE